MYVMKLFYRGDGALFDEFFLSYTTDMIVERSAHWHVSRRYSSAVGSLAEKEEEQ